ncbi:MAG: hypothetical protein IIT98_00550, partial [Kiritimatiellae bacterium]|nr:hypothetical protein [Kiritimatiellia bacterium]
VRSEPESNSQKKKVLQIYFFLRRRAVSGTATSEEPLTNKYCSASLPKVRFNEPISRRISNIFRFSKSDVRLPANRVRLVGRTVGYSTTAFFCMQGKYLKKCTPLFRAQMRRPGPACFYMENTKKTQSTAIQKAYVLRRSRIVRRPARAPPIAHHRTTRKCDSDCNMNGKKQYVKTRIRP